MGVSASSSSSHNLVQLSSASAPASAHHQLETAQQSYRWNQENYSGFRRRVDIWRFVFALLYKLWSNNQSWTYRGGVSPEKRTARLRSQAIWIRESLLELGPTFIKVGQLFSTRADLFTSEYVEELVKLQDRVPAFSYEQAKAIIEADLGKPINQLFAHFDPTPLAAASLGQVHKAQLHAGEEVVVKVQRPGLKKLFAIDLEILKRIAQYFQNHPKWGEGRDWLGIYAECANILWQEADYFNEGRNADTFRRNFRHRDWVNVPRVYWRYTALRVLTLEYLPGIKISHHEALDAAGLDRKHIARLSAQAYLQQLLDDGFFHADPHPGNLAVSAEGALIFYDFGMMGRIQSNVRQQLMETLFGVAAQDAERIIASLIDLGALVPIGDLGPVRRSIQFMLDNFMDKPFEEQSIQAISDDLFEVAYDQPFRFPATFTFVMRAFSTLEGVGKGLDSDFNFMQVVQPYAMELMANDNFTPGGSFLDSLGRQAAQVSNSALGLPRRIEDTITTLERGDLRVRVRASESDRLLRRLGAIQLATNYTLLISAFVISATLLWVNQQWVIALLMILVVVLPFSIALFRILRRIERWDRIDRKLE